MRTVKDLIKELQKFPEDAECCAYEGECTGLAIVYNEQCGFIHCGHDIDMETEQLEEK